MLLKPNVPGHRVVFTFNDRSYQTLQALVTEGNYATMADAVRDALSVMKALRSQAKDGFTEIQVRNPETGEQRVIAVDWL